MKKKLYILSAVLIIIGLIVVIAFGFNVDLKYRNHKSVVVQIGEEFNLKDVKTITDEVFGKEKISLQKSGLYNDELTIGIKDVNDDQLNALKNKFNEKYNINQKIHVLIGDEYSAEDVKAIASEVLAKEDIKVEKEKDNEKYVAIETNMVTKLDMENLNKKINEKYNLSNKVESISTTNIIKTYNTPRVRLRDMSKQYLLYVAIATVIVIAYFAVRFKKLGMKNVVVKPIISLAVAELLFMSIIAITRLPVNKLIVIAAFTVYMVVLTYYNVQYTNATKTKK